MSVAKFEIGDLVWAKKKNYPLWPAKISQPPKEKKKKGMHYLCFLGTRVCAWVVTKKIQHQAEHLIPPNYEKKSPFLKLAIDEIILLSKDKPFKEAREVSPEIGVQNLEEKEFMGDKQLMEKKQPTIKRCSYEGKSTVKEKQSLKEPIKEKQLPVEEGQLSLKEPVKEKQPHLEEKQPSLKEPVKEKQPPVEEKQPSLKEPVKEKQPPVEEKQPFLKEPVKEKQPPVEGKQPSLKEPVKEKQPPVEGKQPSLKEPVKEKQPPVEGKQPSLKEPAKEKQPPVKGKILSRKKPKKVEKAGDSVKSPRLVGRKCSLSKGSVIGETSMSGFIPCPEIQKLDEDDSSHNKSSTDLCNSKNLKLDRDDSSHNKSSIDISNRKNLKLDDKHPVSSLSFSHSVYPGLIFRGFPNDDDDNDDDDSDDDNDNDDDGDDDNDNDDDGDDDSVSSSSSRFGMEPPTSKKIGFLGLGEMGRRIVKNLLTAGHKLIVWNRTKDKCKEFVEAGATQAENPAEVVKAADIIFNCVSDVYAVKTILFCPDGVLKGLEDSCAGENIFKGYVEMSSIGYESSREIANYIIHEGGRYLEAPMTGTKTSANLGALFILASGDAGVFYECLTCFHAIADKTYFLSDEIGVSSLFSITLSMQIGTAYAALAEVIALANQLKISMNDVLALLHMRGIASKPLLEKGRNMIKGKFFNVEQSLTNQQKDIDLGLDLGKCLNYPLPMAAAANEVYKHAKRRGYGDHDVSAVFQGVKH